MRAVGELLRLAEERFPVPGVPNAPKRHHALTLGPDGELVLSLAARECWHAFNLDDADLDRAPSGVLYGWLGFMRSTAAKGETNAATRCLGEH